VTDQERYAAEAVKYSSALVWCFAEIRPGLFALYNYRRELALVTTDFGQLLSCYQARPQYIPRAVAPKIKLEFQI
jgi:hypothetical protein